MKTLKIAALASVIALSGCSSSGVKNTSASPSGDKQTSSTPAESSSSKSKDTSSAGTEADSSGSSLTKAYGSTFTWDDGVAVTASKPQAYTFSDPSLATSMGNTFKKFVVINFSLKNGSKQPYNPMTLTVTATTGDKQTDALFDSAKGVDLPTADVLPGKSLTWKEVFGVSDTGELVLTVENGFGNAKGYYK